MRAVVLSLLFPALAWSQDFTDPEDLSLGPLPKKAEEVPPVEVPAEPPVEAPAEPQADVPPTAASTPAVEVVATEEVAPEPPTPALWRNTVAIGATGGYEFATAQPVAGLGFSLHHDGTRGIAPIARAASLAAFSDQRPMFQLEAGFMAVTRSHQGLVRIGLAGGTLIQVADFPTPLQVGTPVEGSIGQPAFLPYGQVLAEVGGLKPLNTKGILAWAVGVRLGAGAAVGRVECEESEQGCVAVRAGFLGGVYGRVRFHEGVFLEVLAGPTAMISLGYALTPKWQRTAP